MTLFSSLLVPNWWYHSMFKKRGSNRCSINLWLVWSYLIWGLHPQLCLRSWASLSLVNSMTYLGRKNQILDVLFCFLLLKCLLPLMYKWEKRTIVTSTFSNIWFFKMRIVQVFLITWYILIIHYSRYPVIDLERRMIIVLNVA